MTVSCTLALGSTCVIAGNQAYVTAVLTNTGSTALTVSNVIRNSTPMPASQNSASLIGLSVPANGGTAQYTWAEIYTNGTADQNQIVTISVEIVMSDGTVVVPVFAPQLTVISNTLYGNPSPSAQNFPAKGQPDGRYNVNSGLNILFQGCL